MTIGRYQAPAVDAVTPMRIPPGEEYLELVTAGTVLHEGRDGVRELGCGALFWEVAGDRTISRTRAASPYACLTLRFKTGRRARRPVPLLTVLSNRDTALELDRELFDAFHDPSADRALLGAYAYTRLLWEAMRAARSTPPRRPDALEQLLARLDAGAPLNCSVAELAARAGISEPHLHLLFRRHLDTTPHQYLLARRLGRARLLLAGTRQPIKRVSDACGFARIETFCRAFRLHVGSTPGAYRARHTVRTDA
jgi:AraC-like DNA-binding protein